MTSPTRCSDDPAGVTLSAAEGRVERSFFRVSDLLGKVAGVEVAVDTAMTASAALKQVQHNNVRASDLLGKATGVEAAMAASAALKQVQHNYVRVSDLLGKATGVEAAMAASAALKQVQHNYVRVSDLLGKATGVEAAMAASAALKHVERIYTTTASTLKAAEGIDAALRMSTSSIGVVTAQYAPSDLAAHSRKFDAALDEPALMPTPDHDIELAPADEDDTEGRLLFLLACMISLIVLLVAAQVVDLGEVVPQARLWVRVLGDKVLHSAEFNGWLLLYSVAISAVAVRRR